jgi:hypothetical protein
MSSTFSEIYKQQFVNLTWFRLFLIVIKIKTRKKFSWNISKICKKWWMITSKRSFNENKKWNFLSKRLLNSTPLLNKSVKTYNCCDLGHKSEETGILGKAQMQVFDSCMHCGSGWRSILYNLMCISALFSIITVFHSIYQIIKVSIKKIIDREMNKKRYYHDYWTL